MLLLLALVQLDQSVKSLGKFNHVGAILFALKDFNRKNLKNFVELLTCTSQFSNWNVPRGSSTYPTAIDKTLLKKLNLETIFP